MQILEILFWFAALVVFYTYLLYPLLMAVLARVCPRPVQRSAAFSGSVSFVLCVHNEENRIEARLEELIQLLKAGAQAWEIVVVSDGSTDATVRLARAFAEKGVRVIELAENVGKAVALSRGCAEARHDILVFGDVRQRWAGDAVELLVRNFADPRVGAVSGELVIESSAGVMAGVGLYWRYEKWLRNNQGRVHSTVGVTGAICAVRRDLFRPIPGGIMLDDVYWPLQVNLQCYRVVHDNQARAFDRFPEKTRDEFRRKVRTLSGCFQLLTRLPGAALPWCNPIWFQFLSHKIARLVVPWALLVMLVSCVFLDGTLYRSLLAVQLLGYSVGLLGLFTPVATRCKSAAAVGSVLVLNLAALMAFWVWISGRASKSWHKVRYDTPQLTPLETTASPHS
jgi:biofilm PGA synthesis N-glycosyltransferase PgaC